MEETKTIYYEAEKGPRVHHGVYGEGRILSEYPAEKEAWFEVKVGSIIIHTPAIEWQHVDESL